MYALDEFWLDDPAPRRRLQIATGIALALHIAVILGVGFTALPKRTPETIFSLNISLVEQSGGKPEEAGGELPPPEATIPDPSNEAETTSAAPQASEQQALPVVDTSQPSTFAIERSALESQNAPSLSDEQQRSAPLKLSRVTPATLTDSTSETANESENLSSANDEQTKRVREKYINPDEASTLEGYYAENWRLKVEQIATTNFPRAARRLKLVGKLTLDVALRADGSVESVELVRSSGHPILDNAARQIVYMAAPYEPFPEELKSRYDILHIIRTWEFDQGGRLETVGR